jgi:hypothetical protein
VKGMSLEQKQNRVVGVVWGDEIIPAKLVNTQDNYRDVNFGTIGTRVSAQSIVEPLWVFEPLLREEVDGKKAAFDHREPVQKKLPLIFQEAEKPSLVERIKRRISG